MRKIKNGCFIISTTYSSWLCPSRWGIAFRRTFNYYSLFWKKGLYAFHMGLKAIFSVCLFKPIRKQLSYNPIEITNENPSNYPLSLEVIEEESESVIMLFRNFMKVFKLIFPLDKSILRKCFFEIKFDPTLSTARDRILKLISFSSLKGEQCRKNKCVCSVWLCRTSFRNL